MAKMLLMRVNEIPQEVEVTGLQDLYKYLECNTIDSVGLYSYKNGERVVIWLDDEGLLDNKPMNRGYAGHLLIGKVNDEGCDIDLPEEDVKKVKAMFDEQENSCNSPIIKSYINTYDREPFIKNFDFKSGKTFFDITVSHLDIFKHFQNVKNNEIINLIETGITGVVLGLVDEEEFLSVWAEHLANSIYNERKKYTFGF